MVWRVTSPPTASKAPARAAASCAPATSICRASRTTAPSRSAATSSPATAANGANTAWKNISRSRRSPASTPRKLYRRCSAGAGFSAPAFCIFVKRRTHLRCNDGLRLSTLRIALSSQRALRVHIQRIDRLARGHEQPVALEPAETQIGAALGQRDAADQYAVGGVDHDAVEF